jgi:glycosyl transferase family 25
VEQNYFHFPAERPAQMQDFRHFVDRVMIPAKRQFPPIWVVSLKRSNERREFISQHLNKLGLPAQFVDAVDGHDLSQEQLASLYDEQKAVELLQRKLIPEEIGCSLSHLKLYQKMIDEKVDEAVILEDDALIAPVFTQVVSQRTLFAPDWELILLCHWNNKEKYISYRQRKTIHNQYKLVKFFDPPFGTVAYLLRRSAAQKLLSHAFPVRMPADTLISNMTKITGVRVYGISPVIVYHYQNGGFYPTMEEREKLHEKIYKRPIELEGLGLKKKWWHYKDKVITFYKSVHPRYIV